MRFGRLTAVRYVGPGVHGPRWAFACADCGAEIVRPLLHVQAGIENRHRCKPPLPAWPFPRVVIDGEVVSPVWRQIDERSQDPLASRLAPQLVTPLVR